MTGVSPSVIIRHMATGIRHWRKQRGLLQKHLAEHLGITIAQVSRLEKGDRQLKMAEATRLAGFLNVPLGALLDAGAQVSVPVVGYVGAGAEVFPLDDLPESEGMRRVNCPPNLDPRKTVAVEIRGDSMAPIGDGWLAFYTRDPEHGPSDVLGHLCICKLTDGRTLLKRIKRGYSEGRYNLLSTNAEMIEDAELEWAAPVKAFLPSSGDFSPRGPANDR